MKLNAWTSKILYFLKPKNIVYEFGGPEQFMKAIMILCIGRLISVALVETVCKGLKYEQDEFGTKT